MNGAVNHDVIVLPVGTMQIRPCIACEYCHTKGNGECIQRDDMDKVYKEIKDADMIIFASPIHYYGLSGQLQAVLSRFYAFFKPNAKKYTLFLSSAEDGVFEAVIEQYKNNVSYFGAEDLGVFYAYGNQNQSKEFMNQLEQFGSSL